MEISNLEDTGFIELSDKHIARVRSSIEEGIFSDHTEIERISQKAMIVLTVQITDQHPNQSRSLPKTPLTGS